MGHYHLGAMLGMLSVAQLMLTTDTIIVYIFAMAPFGILIGTSVSLDVVRRWQFRQMRQTRPVEINAISVLSDE